MGEALDEFIETIARLRAPDGCPWDREQTHKTLARYLLEETYEVLEAIESGDPRQLQEELGDLLLQIVLQAQVAADGGKFTIEDVARGINTKMIARHPHVFAGATVASAEAVVARWESMKNREKVQSSVVDNIPEALPALLKALKVSEKAVSEGFEWDSLDQIFEQLHSELDELREELKHPDHENRMRERELEIGDVLFTIVNISRWQRINPEEALLAAIEKFRKRYRQMGSIAEKPLSEVPKGQLEALWRQAKQMVDSP